MLKIVQAFVLAGGKGERLKPITNDTPKPLVKVAGKPILEYNVELLAMHGVKEIILATGHLHHKLEAHFGNGKKFGVLIKYSVEKEPLGTGGALKAAEPMLGPRFFMLNGDNIADFHLTEMAEAHFAFKALATIALKEVEDVTGFGVARLEGNRIAEFVEKPAKGSEPSHFVNAGTYVIEKEALGLLPSGFNLIEKTLFPQLAARGKLFAHMHKGMWLTTDTFERLEKAENALLTWQRRTKRI